MANANVKMGVSGLTEFKRNINDAKATVKAFDEALKLNETQADTSSLYITNKISIMKDQIQAQTDVVRRTQEALDAMLQNGTSKSSKSYQDMLGQHYGAITKLEEMKKTLEGIESGASGSAGGLNSMDEAVGNIEKNQSWQNVSEGVEKLVGTLERGARAAFNFGKKVFNAFKESTSWADDLKTMSDRTGYSVEKLQQMQNVAEIVDTDVEAIINAQKRMSKAVAGEGREDIADLFGINITGNENPEDLFWDIGEALMGMGESFDKEAAAQKVFGRSWNELIPLFKTGREEYEKMLGEQHVLTEEQIENLTKADDKIKELELQIQTMKNEFWADNADKIEGLLDWITKHQGEITTALMAIGGAFGAMKLGEFAINLQKTVSAFQTLGWFGGNKDSGNPDVSINSGSKSGSSGFSKAMNILALIGAAGSVSRATEGNLHEEWKNLETETAGMSGRELGYKILQHDTGMTDAEMADLEYRMTHETGSSYGHSFGEPDETEAKLDRMCELAEEGNKEQREANKNAPTAADIEMLNSLPDRVESSVIRGMSKVTIVIDDRGVEAINSRAGRAMWSNVMTLAK